MVSDGAVLNRLRFRRQFIFGPRPVSLAGEWQSQRFGTDWVLTAQRDLPLCRGAAADGAELVLLGFLIDPEAPSLTDQQLFGRLCQCRSWEELLEATLNLSGRWALFHIAGRQVRVLNDATGLRSIYYAVAGQEPWCFSQPGLYRRVQAVEYSPEAVQFVHSVEGQKDFEVCFPAASSPYAEVAHLLPNHYLDLASRVTTRFWPTQALEPVTLEAAVERVAHILQQSMAAMAARGPVALAMTAGRDSRTLLAAGRSVTERLWAYTLLHGDLSLASPDFTVSAELCRVAGIEHHILRCPQSMREPLKSIYLNNHDPAHPVWGRICQGILDQYPPAAMAVWGNVSEASRCVFYQSGQHPETLQGSDLARKCKMPVSAFTTRHFDHWLAEAAPGTALGYKALDLFFLEHRMPNWLAVSETEYDLIHDTFSPYSNRRLFGLMMGAPTAARIKPKCVLYTELVRAMWPELLAFPFNPPKPRRAKLLHQFRKATRQVGGLFGWRPVQVSLEWRGGPGAPCQT